MLEQAINEVVHAGLNHYSFFEGVDELRRAVAEKIKMFNGITVNPDAQPLELMITPGGTGGIVTFSHAHMRGASAGFFLAYYPYHKKKPATFEARKDVVKLRGANLLLHVGGIRPALCPAV